jgi:hypothetical protein
MVELSSRDRDAIKAMRARVAMQDRPHVDYVPFDDTGPEFPMYDEDKRRRALERSIGAVYAIGAVLALLFLLAAGAGAWWFR